MARDFDGSNDNIDFGNINAFEKDESFSLFQWIKRDATGGIDPIISKLFSNATLRGYEFVWRETDKLQFFLINSWPTNAIQVTADNANTTTDYIHTGITYDGSEDESGVEIFEDGSGVTHTADKNTLTGTTVTTEGLQIGERPNGTLDFTGLQSHSAMWSGVLSQDHVDALSHGVSPLVIRDDILTFCPPLWGNESPEPNYVDSSNNGTVTGATRGVPNPPVELMENYL